VLCFFWKNTSCLLSLLIKQWTRFFFRNVFIILCIVRFAATETPGNIHTISSIHRFPQWKSFVLNRTAYSRTQVTCATLCFTHSRLNWTVWLRHQTMQCTVHAAIGLAVCVMQRPLNLPWVWVLFSLGQSVYEVHNWHPLFAYVKRIRLSLKELSTVNHSGTGVFETVARWKNSTNLRKFWDTDLDIRVLLTSVCGVLLVLTIH
jgi:hypothetical protein